MTRQEGNSTTPQMRRQTRRNVARVGKVMRAGHRLGGGVGGCSSGIIRGKKIVGSELSECKRTHTYTHFSNIRWESFKKLSFSRNFEHYSSSSSSSACHMFTYHSTHNTSTTRTHMQCQHTHRSGPHKLAVRLLLYRGCHTVESLRA